MDFNNILYFACAFAVLPFDQPGCLGKSVAGTVAVFVITVQLYLIETQPRPTPFALQQGNKIALLSHIACFKQPSPPCATFSALSEPLYQSLANHLEVVTRSTAGV